ncbi:hypothetical protein [Desulfuromonas thiophila]|uniref:Uncharacterized protein n=1 Tax=Desulfuromonas thiophila TaxID=57664 RepID=A0A1G7F6F3_9BACT|nr:hypothetical protein [Desulfuromonas thiophila]SDE71366.1 hypothetical protein SAMN05661003_1294 [Desulfuromonas thiophila]
MHRKFKNRAALRLLIRQLTGASPFSGDGLRLQCRTLLSACFLMGIEPFQLPLAETSCGDLSELQRREFLQRYLVLQIDEAARNRLVLQLLGNPAWFSLLRMADNIVREQEIASRTEPQRWTK